MELRVDDDERELWIAAGKREGYLSLSDWCRDRLNNAAKSRVHYSSDDPTWNTPPDVLDPLVAALGPIALDPCGNAGSVVPAAMVFRLDHEHEPYRDGLRASWDWRLEHEPGWKARGFVFVNPPYGDELPHWVEKCTNEARRGTEIVALVPARTDTRWWELAASTCTSILLWRGRVTFLGAPSTAPFPVALIYWGKRPERFARIDRGRVFSGGGA